MTTHDLERTVHARTLSRSERTVNAWRALRTHAHGTERLRALSVLAAVCWTAHAHYELARAIGTPLDILTVQGHGLLPFVLPVIIDAYVIAALRTWSAQALRTQDVRADIVRWGLTPDVAGALVLDACAVAGSHAVQAHGVLDDRTRTIAAACVGVLVVVVLWRVHVQAVRARLLELDAVRCEPVTPVRAHGLDRAVSLVKTMRPAVRATEAVYVPTVRTPVQIVRTVEAVRPAVRVEVPTDAHGRDRAVSLVKTMRPAVRATEAVYVPAERTHARTPVQIVRTVEAVRPAVRVEVPTDAHGVPTPRKRSEPAQSARRTVTVPTNDLPSAVPDSVRARGRGPVQTWLRAQVLEAVAPDVSWPTAAIVRELRAFGVTDGSARRMRSDWMKARQPGRAAS